MSEAVVLGNVTVVSVEIDRAHFASICVRDNNTGDVYVIPGGYVQSVSHPAPLCSCDLPAGVLCAAHPDPSD